MKTSRTKLVVFFIALMVLTISIYAQGDRGFIGQIQTLNTYNDGRIHDIEFTISQAVIDYSGEGFETLQEYLDHLWDLGLVNDFNFDPNNVTIEGIKAGSLATKFIFQISPMESTFASWTVSYIPNPERLIKTTGSIVDHLQDFIAPVYDRTKPVLKTIEVGYDTNDNVNQLVMVFTEDMDTAFTSTNGVTVSGVDLPANGIWDSQDHTRFVLNFTSSVKALFYHDIIFTSAVELRDTVSSLNRVNTAGEYYVEKTIRLARENIDLSLSPTEQTVNFKDPVDVTATILYPTFEEGLPEDLLVDALLTSDPALPVDTEIEIRYNDTLVTTYTVVDDPLGEIWLSELLSVDRTTLLAHEGRTDVWTFSLDFSQEVVLKDYIISATSYYGYNDFQDPSLVYENMTEDTTINLISPVYNETQGIYYATIQDAIDYADVPELRQNPDVIAVAAGIYTEQLYVWKPVDLRGPNHGIHGTSEYRNYEAIIRFPDGESSWVHMYIIADGVTVDGFSFRDEGYGDLVNYTAIYSNSVENLTVANNIFEGFTYTTIILSQAHPADTPKENIKVLDNYFKENHGLYHTIYLMGVGGTVSGNKVEDCAAAIQIQPYAQTVGGIVENNEFAAYANAIYYNYAMYNAGKWIFEENVITPAAAPSAARDSTNDENILGLSPIATQGVREGQIWSGIFPRTFATQGSGTAPEVEFKNNYVDGSGANDPYWSEFWAVRIKYTSESAVASFIGNTFTNTDVGTMIESDANVTNFTMRENKYINNDSGVDNKGSGILDAVENWWGDETGPYHIINPMGQGDSVSDHVDYHPWYIDEDMTTLVGEYLVENVDKGTLYFNIQDAIDDALEGNIIEVNPGIYEENLVIDKKLTLIGNNSTRNDVVVDGGGAGTVVTIEADEVIFEGFTVQNSGSNATDAGIFLDQVDDCEIINNTVTDNANGIAIVIGSNNSIIENSINSSVLYGIVLVGSFGNTIELNSIDSPQLDGIALANASEVGGPAYLGSTGNFIKTNTISNGSRDGIFVGENCHGNYITDVNVLNNIASIGISIWRPDQQTITDNIVTNSLTGIRLLGSSDNMISGNTVTYNDIGIKIDASWQAGVWYSSQNNSISENIITDNISYGMQADDPQQNVIVDARNNWWGNESGPIHNSNPGGTGDEISNNIVFNPWYLDEELTELSDVFLVENVTEGKFYFTIQSAIDDADDGNTIKVSPGIYNENLFIDVPNLTIESTDGWEYTTIDAGGADRGVDIQSNLGSFTLKGFEVIGWQQAGITQPWRQREGTSSHILENKVIGTGDEVHGNCIQVTGDYSTVIGNIVEGAQYVGEGVYGATGILVYLANNTLVQDNVVSNSDNGIAIAGGNPYGQTAVYGVQVIGNTVYDSGEGITVQFDAFDTYITENIVYDCEVGLEELFMWDAGPANTTAENNNFAGNDTGALIYTDGTTIPVGHILTATHNWWGTTDYNELLATIIGYDESVEELIPGLIDFTPYLMNDILDPEDPGYATGDVWPVFNVNQDKYYTTLQAAISEAYDDEEIQIQGTLELTGNISLNKRLIIDGIDKETSTITGDNSLPSIGGGRYFMLITSGGAGSTIRNITFEKLDKAGPQNIIGLQANNITFENCNFFGQYVLGDPDVSRAFEVAYNIAGFIIQNNNIQNLRQPAYFNPGSVGQILNNYVDQTRGWVVIGGSIEFLGNSWGENAVDIYLGPDVHFGPPYDPLYALSANNSNANIDDGRTGENLYFVENVTQAKVYLTLQEAINDAYPGDELFISEGEYLHTTSINVDRSIIIRGAGQDGTIIQGNYGTSRWWFLFNITADTDVTLADMTITAVNGEQVGSFTYGYLIGQTGDVHTSTDNLTIDNIHFPAGRRAVFAKGENLIIQNCLFTGNWQRANIELGGGSFTITNNTFESRHYQHGALITGGSEEISGQFTNNIVRSNAIEGWFKTNGSVFAIEFYNDNLGEDGIVFDNNEFDGDYFDPGLNQSGYPMLNRPLYVEYYLKYFNPDRLSFTDNSVSGYYSGIFVPLTSTVAGNDFSNQASNHIRYDRQGETDQAAVVAKIEYDLTQNTFDKGVYSLGPNVPPFPGIWTTIASGINEASSGDTVQVLSATYEEQLAIKKSLNLVAEEETIILAPPAAERVTQVIPETTRTFNPIVFISGDPDLINVTISGFEIDGNDDPGVGNYVGILARNADLNINNNSIHSIWANNETLGIAVYGGEEVTIADNYVTDFSRVAIVAFDTVTEAMIENNVITGPGYVTGWAPNGIQVVAAALAEIRENTLSEIGWVYSGSGTNYTSTGIYVSDMDDLTISNNVLNNVQVGIRPANSSFLAEGNEITYTDVTGLASIGGIWGNPVGPPDAVASPFDLPEARDQSRETSNLIWNYIDNIIIGDTSTSGYGLGIWTYADGRHVIATATGNKITNWYLGVAISSDDDFEGNINENEIAYNTYGVWNWTNTVVNATYNWWGDWSGPAHATNNLGAGNPISNKILFSPWYFQEEMETLNGLPALALSEVGDISTVTGTPIVAEITVNYPDLTDYEPSILTDALISTETAFPAGTKVIKVVYNNSVEFDLDYDLTTGNTHYLSQILGNPDPYGTPLVGHSGLPITWTFIIEGASAEISELPVSIQSISYLERPGVTREAGYNELGDPEEFTITYADVDFQGFDDLVVGLPNSIVIEWTEWYPLIENIGGAKVLNDSKFSVWTEDEFGVLEEAYLPEGATITVTIPGATPVDRTSILEVDAHVIYGSAVVTEQGDPRTNALGYLAQLTRPASTVAAPWTVTINGADPGNYSIKFEAIAVLNYDEDGYPYEGEYVYAEAEFAVDAIETPSALYVDDDWADLYDYLDEIEPGLFFGHNAFATIQSAIDAANPGDEILVAEGEYVEALYINKAISIEGSGRDYTIVKAPATLPQYYWNSNMSIVVAIDATDASISEITIDGDRRLSNNFIGIHFWKSSGSLTDSRVTGIMASELGGGQNVNAILVNHVYDVYEDYIVTVERNIIDDYQKTGIVVNEPGSFAYIYDNIITGQGPTGVIAQNGIQIGYGANAHIKGNNVTGHWYTGEGWSSSGIMVVGANGVIIEDNTSNENEVGIYIAKDAYYGYNGSEDVQILDNTIENSMYGLVLNVDCSLEDFQGNSFVNNVRQISDQSETIDLETALTENSYDKIILVRFGNESGSRNADTRQHIDNIAVRTDPAIKVPIVFTVIQDAIDYSGTEDGDIVDVYANTYEEQLVIVKGLNIIGREGAVIKAPPAAERVTQILWSTIYDPIIYIDGRTETIDVTFSGFEIDGNDDPSLQFVGILSQGANVTITNNNIHSMLANVNTHGIIVAEGEYATIEGNTVTDFARNAITVFDNEVYTSIVDNIIIGRGYVGQGYAAQNGIQFDNLFSNGEGLISGNTLSEIGWIWSGTGSSWSATGILPMDVSYVEITDNVLTNVQVAIRPINSNFKAEENTVTIDNAGDLAYIGGIWGNPQGRPETPANPFNIDQRADRVSLTGTRTELTWVFLNNEVVNNDGNAYDFGGIGIWPDTGMFVSATAEGNTVSGWITGFDIWGSNDFEATLHNNTIVGNDYGVYNWTDTEVDATLNWWGSEYGPTHSENPLGDGDEVTDLVLYDPWWADEQMTILGTNDAIAQAVDAINALGDAYFLSEATRTEVPDFSLFTGSNPEDLLITQSKIADARALGNAVTVDAFIDTKIETEFINWNAPITVAVVMSEGAEAGTFRAVSTGEVTLYDDGAGIEIALPDISDIAYAYQQGYAGEEYFGDIVSDGFYYHDNQSIRILKSTDAGTYHLFIRVDSEGRSAGNLASLRARESLDRNVVNQTRTISGNRNVRTESSWYLYEWNIETDQMVIDNIKLYEDLVYQRVTDIELPDYLILFEGPAEIEIGAEHMFYIPNPGGRITHEQEWYYNIYPEEATIKNLIWDSDNEVVVSVNENGALTPGEPGIATVTVTTVDGELIATTEVTVDIFYGDIDNDWMAAPLVDPEFPDYSSPGGGVGVNDALAALKYSVNLNEFEDDPWDAWRFTRANVTGGTRISAYDASQIYQYYTFVIHHFEYLPARNTRGEIVRNRQIASPQVNIEFVEDMILISANNTTELYGLNVSIAHNEFVTLGDAEFNLPESYLHITHSDEYGFNLGIAASIPEIINGYLVMIPISVEEDTTLNISILSNLTESELELPVEANILSTEEPLPTLVNSVGMNYPNPFNPTTTINYSVKEASLVRIDVYNIKGQHVKTLVNEEKNAGHHTILWHGENSTGRSVSSGVYFYMVSIGNEFRKTQRMMLLK